MDDYRRELHLNITEQYRAIRSANEEKRRRLLERLYAHMPRLKEIDDELDALGLSVCGEVLSKGLSPERAVAAMQKRSEQLLQEKRDILQQAGISPEITAPLYTCHECKDTGIVDNHRCACYHQKVRAQLQQASHVTKTDASFERFDVTLYSTEVYPAYGISPRENAEVALDIAKSFAQEQPGAPDHLYLYGATGLGKTFTSECIAKEFISRGKFVVYHSAPRLFSLFEDYKFGRDTSSKTKHLIDSVWDCDLLMIDDLGTEFRSTYVDSILFDIINTRLSGRLHTVISTNLTPANLAGTYSDRIASRILGGFNQVLFFGDDLRIRRR